MAVINVVSLSGGKDSTALGLLSIEQGVENLRFVFADTGHEHPTTYSYINYLDGVFRERSGVGIDWVKADFREKIEARRMFIARDRRTRRDRKTGRKVRWSNKAKRRALEALKPTGIPFLDLCMVKGRFPASQTRFCTEKLKHEPINEYIDDLISAGNTVVSWQGIRADESPSRALMAKYDVEFGSWDPKPEGWLIYRPLLDWKADEVFDFHRKHGVEWNPLYERGMSRVGCMPCIMARKNEIKEIARQFPEEVDRVEQWEGIVAEASKRGLASFFSSDKTPGEHVGKSSRQPGIVDVVEWSKTTRGGRQYELIPQVQEDDGPSACTSVYGLCE